jgi:hypothetical protein
MQHQDGPLTLDAFKGTAVFLGQFALAAGICTIAASIGRSTMGTCWPLVLSGLALSALGLISGGMFGLRDISISFRTVAILFVVMAASIGILELVTARTLRRHVADGWLFGLAGAASLGFAWAFLALAFRWIEIDLSAPGDPVGLIWHSRSFLWFGAYFGFSAICMLGLALRLHTLGPSQSGQLAALPPLGNPRHAH